MNKFFKFTTNELTADRCSFQNEVFNKCSHRKPNHVDFWCKSRALLHLPTTERIFFIIYHQALDIPDHLQAPAKILHQACQAETGVAEGL